MGSFLNIAGSLVVLICGVAIQNVVSNPAPNQPSFVCTYPDFEYYIGEDERTHDFAHAACQSLNLNYTGLAIIDTQAVHAQIRECIVGHPVGSEYWINGYFTGGTQWAWSTNQPFPDWAPWEIPGHPTNSFLHSPALRYYGPLTSYWITLPSTELRKYICKRPTGNSI